MSPTPDEYEDAAIARIESWVRGGAPLMVGLSTERAWLISAHADPEAEALLRRLVSFPTDTHDFDKTPVSVRMAFDDLRDAVREHLKQHKS